MDHSTFFTFVRERIVDVFHFVLQAIVPYSIKIVLDARVDHIWCYSYRRSPTYTSGRPTVTYLNTKGLLGRSSGRQYGRDGRFNF